MGAETGRAPVAVVTGAGSGIGREAAQQLLDHGYRVALLGRRAELLEETREDRSPDRCLVVPTDVSDPAEVDAAFARVVEAFGRIDVLFNNAGQFGRSAPFEELPIEVWRSVVDTNVTGVFLCAQAAYRVMKEQDPQGGRIINNGSLSAHVPRPHAVAYTTSKHAVSGLTKTIALEGRAHRIACGQIDVGNAMTDMAALATGGGALQPDGSVIMEPYMAVGDVAALVVQMAALPLEANVLSMTVMASAMPYVGRG